MIIIIIILSSSQMERQKIPNNRFVLYRNHTIVDFRLLVNIIIYYAITITIYSCVCGIPMMMWCTNSRPTNKTTFAAVSWWTTLYSYWQKKNKIRRYTKRPSSSGKGPDFRVRSVWHLVKWEIGIRWNAENSQHAHDASLSRKYYSCT